MGRREDMGELGRACQERGSDELEKCEGRGEGKKGPMGKLLGLISGPIIDWT